MDRDKNLHESCVNIDFTFHHLREPKVYELQFSLFLVNFGEKFANHCVFSHEISKIMGFRCEWDLTILN